MNYDTVMMTRKRIMIKSLHSDVPLLFEYQILCSMESAALGLVSISLHLHLCCVWCSSASKYMPLVSAGSSIYTNRGVS
jgi:hypothetical protein